MRVLRSDMIATLQEDYIAMAKAKGLKPARILLVHALKPSSLTLVTVTGINIGRLIGGALIVETIFALPGIGRLLVGAIYARDFIILQGVVLFVAVGFVVDELHRRHALCRARSEDPPWPRLSGDATRRRPPVRRRRRLGRVLDGDRWIGSWRSRSSPTCCRCTSPTDMDMLERARAVPAPSIGSAPTVSAATNLSRLIYGARISLTVGLLAPVIGVMIGGALGMLAGYFRGRSRR